MERLQKVIANAGYCSRRKAEILIANGNVKVNDEIVTKLGCKVGKNDLIKINNKPLHFSTENIYLMLNKPRNCVSTVTDPKNRETVMSYVREIEQRIYPIGRLDYDTSGLLLMTNDGDFTNHIIHPKHSIDKTYEVLVDGIMNHRDAKKLEHGVQVAPDFITSPAKAKIKSVNDKKHQTVLELTIHEGKNHQVKRMIIAIGFEVLKLKRVKISFLELDDNLKPGEFRYLKPKEVKRFHALFK